MIEKKFLDIKRHINEGDVLLFRGKGFIARLISSSTETPYSHVGIASWVNGYSNTDEGILECVEFREGSFLSGLFGMSSGGGGRSINLFQEVKKNSGRIDVYRPNPIFFNYTFNEKTKDFILSKKSFDGKKVSAIMRRMTGLPYGWRRVWWIFKHKLILYRLFHSDHSLTYDELGEVIYPVCSTALSYAFNSQGYDLVNNRSDEWTEPGDIAKSTQLTYLGTLIV